jgi:hypothetical protein
MSYNEDYNCMICEDKNIDKFCFLSTNLKNFKDGECLWCELCVFRNQDICSFYNVYEECIKIYDFLKNMDDNYIYELETILKNNKNKLINIPHFIIACYLETEYSFLKVYFKRLFSKFNFNYISNLEIKDKWVKNNNQYKAIENCKSEYKNIEQKIQDTPIDNIFCLSFIIYILLDVDIQDIIYDKELFLNHYKDFFNHFQSEYTFKTKDEYILICLINRISKVSLWNNIFLNKNEIVNNNDLKIISILFDLNCDTPLSNFKFYFTNKYTCFFSNYLYQLNDIHNIKFHSLIENKNKILYNAKYFLCKTHSHMETPYLPSIYNQDFVDSIIDENFYIKFQQESDNRKLFYYLKTIQDKDKQQFILNYNDITIENLNTKVIPSFFIDELILKNNELLKYCIKHNKIVFIDEEKYNNDYFQLSLLYDIKNNIDTMLLCIDYDLSYTDNYLNIIK